MQCFGVDALLGHLHNVQGFMQCSVGMQCTGVAVLLNAYAMFSR